MAKKFSGTLEELKRIVSAAGFHGEWGEQNGKHIFRSSNGGMLNWWKKTNTISPQGDKDGGAEIMRALDPHLDGDAPKKRTTAKSAPSVVASAQPQVFVVYGHDKEACLQLENVLLRLDCNPFVLGKTSGAGKTLIEALENEIGPGNTSAFGVVLVTPDDMGCSKDEYPDKAAPRARENVIFEAGMLLASLTRKRVAFLVKGQVALPSDLSGVIYIPFNDHVREAIPKLCEHMIKAKIKIDPQAMASAMASL